MDDPRRHLFFRQLLEELSNQLNFAFGLEKYLLFSYLLDREGDRLNRLLEQDAGQATEELDSFVADCRLLFEQQSGRRADFDRIVRQAVAREQRAFRQRRDLALAALAPEAEEPEKTTAPPPEEEKIPAPPPPPPSEGLAEEAPDTFYQQEWPAGEELAELPLQVSLQPVADAEAEQQQLLEAHRRRYILTNDYLPISSRQMAKTWRYLQFRIADRDSDEIDIPATVRRTAREGFFFEAAYVPRTRNKAGGLVILADRGGSMAPFHTLTDEIVRTARTDGGHERARVLYFRNVPQGHLLDPSEAAPQGTLALDIFLRQIAQAHTAVLIIGDAGAARGRFNARRVSQTWGFLHQLKRHAGSVAWLNPMPVSRWPGSSAAHIAQRVPMFAVLDAGYLGFDKAVKVLRGQQVG